MSVTLTVEDGTIVAGANSFVSIVTFQTYTDNRNWDVSSFDDDAVGAALVKAGDYLNNEERFWWRGNRVNDEQPMAWPRANVIVQLGTGNVIASNLVPQKIKDAQCYIAYKQLTVGDVQPDLERGGAIQSVSAGGVSVSYMNTAMVETLYQVSSGILKPYLRRIYYTIKPSLYSDDRGYQQVINTGGTDGIEDRPGSSDTTDNTLDSIDPQVTQ